MKLFIKYMVSLRCRMVVKDELKKLQIEFVNIDLGVVEISENITPYQREQLKVNLLFWGLELMDDKKDILVEKIKNLIIDMIHYSDGLLKVSNSDYLSHKLGYGYAYMSNLFSKAKGITIQQFIIMHKIEKIKELLLYDELSLSEISYKLHYSSVAHLSNQFKNITGVTPSFYKRLKNKRTLNLEDL
jgi:AraC-like DNA-binding protein